MPPWETHHLLLALASGAILAYTVEQLVRRNNAQPQLDPLIGSKEKQSDPSHTLPTGTPPPAAASLASTIGNTPLVLLPTLSRLTNCSIYAKLELLNPGGSPKDRVALSILQSLSQPSPSLSSSTSTSSSNPPSPSPTLQPNDTIYEGTVGSTGISLATLSRALSYHSHIIMPSDQSREKVSLLRKLGATVTLVPPAPIIDTAHFVNTARRLASEHTLAFESNSPLTLPDGTSVRVQGRGWFANQFETDANWRAHFTGTGPEIWAQTDGRVDAFVAGAGTGGTISGTGLFLKQQNPDVKIVLADPQGSGLYNKVRNGVFWSAYEREGTRRRSQVDTVIEGIGLVRSTRNWEVGSERGVVDEAVKVTDAQARNMARWLVEQEGWFVGGSSAVNCVAALRTAMELGPGHRIVTIMCDSGMRHLSKFWAQVGAIGGDASVSLDDVLSGQDLRAEEGGEPTEHAF